MKTINRILKFDKQDWRHIRFLLKSLIIQFFIKHNWHETKDTYYWIKIHVMYDSERVE